jgi:hypothetical protein
MSFKKFLTNMQAMFTGFEDNNELLTDAQKINKSHIKNKSFKMARQQGGRIRLFERETDDSVVILGANLEIQAAHSQGVRITEQRGLVIRTKRNYRN